MYKSLKNDSRHKAGLKKMLVCCHPTDPTQNLPNRNPKPRVEDEDENLQF